MGFECIVGCSDADASHMFVLGYMQLDRRASSLLVSVAASLPVPGTRSNLYDI
jgi:hypothetical protein